MLGDHGNPVSIDDHANGYKLYSHPDFSHEESFNKEIRVLRFSLQMLLNR